MHCWDPCLYTALQPIWFSCSGNDWPDRYIYCKTGNWSNDIDAGSFFRHSYDSSHQTVSSPKWYLCSGTFCCYFGRCILASFSCFVWDRVTKSYLFPAHPFYVVASATAYLCCGMFCCSMDLSIFLRAADKPLYQIPTCSWVFHSASFSASTLLCDYPLFHFSPHLPILQRFVSSTILFPLSLFSCVLCQSSKL